MTKTLNILTIVVGACMICMGIAVLFTNPFVSGEMPAGFFTPIVALEFMNNIQDLEAFFNIITVDALKKDLYLGNQMDYIYMGLYGTFALLITFSMYLEEKSRALFLSIPLIGLIVVADVYENMHIASILQLQSYSNATLILKNLHMATWLKWGGLSALMLFYSVYFLSKQLLLKALGTSMLISFTLAILAFTLGGVWHELMVFSIMLNFLGLFACAIFWQMKMRISH